MKKEILLVSLLVLATILSYCLSSIPARPHVSYVEAAAQAAARRDFWAVAWLACILLDMALFIKWLFNTR